MMSLPANRTLWFVVIGAAVLLGVAIGLVEARPEYIVAVLIAPIALVLSWRYPQYALVAFVYAGSFKSVVPVPVDATVALAFVVVLLVLREFGRSGLPRFTVGGWLFLAFVVFVVVSGVAFGLSDYGFQKVTRFATLSLLAFIGGAVLIRTDEDVARVADAAIIIGVAMSGWALLTGGLSLSSARFTAFGSNTIAMGRAAGIAFVGAVVRMLWDRRALWWAAPTAVICLLALLGSGSRGPATGSALALAVLVSYRIWTRGARRARVIVAVAIAVTGAFLLWQYLPQASLQRFARISPAATDASTRARVALYAAAWATFQHAPVFGVGTGGFADVVGAYLYPHDFILEVGAENGLAGLLMYLGALVAALLAAMQKAHRTPGYASDFLVVALVVTIVNASVSGDLNDNRVLYVLMGILLARHMAKAVVGHIAASATTPSGSPSRVGEPE